jgi:hypothetical protein
VTSDKWHIFNIVNMSFLTGQLSFVILLLFLILSSCGKEAAPLPPFIRIPESVKDLTVVQSGYNLILTWTNPAKNIDGSAATNLARIRVRSDSTTIATLPVTSAPGKPQSHTIPLNSALDGRRTFTVIIETTQGKTSQVSNTASVTPVQVPGRVAQLHAIVDQRHVTLEWEKPLEHPELADGYVIVRTDTPAESEPVSGTRYEDNQYQPGKVLTYQVTAVRRVAGNTIWGVGPESIAVLVEDKTKPQAPTGLDIVQSDTGAYLTWAPNSETDLAGYRVYHGETETGEFRPISDRLIGTNAFFDPSYHSGQYYRVSAVDEFGNESDLSAALRGP